MKKMKKIALIVSILLNLVLITYRYLETRHLANVYSNLSFALQGDLVQLATAIEEQNNNNWPSANRVLEKIEDVNESIGYLMVTGKDTGIITKSQEDDLWKLSNFFVKYATSSDFSNPTLGSDRREKLKDLGDALQSVGWGPGAGYGGDWDSFSAKVGALINERQPAEG